MISTIPSYKEAEEQVFDMLGELPRNLYYHNLIHTKDVIQAVERLAKSENLSEEDFLLGKTGALYHDIGFLEKYFENEPIGARIARESLPIFDYNPEQIEIVSNMILATALPQNPKTELDRILCDADLDNFRRGDFFCKGELIRRELEEVGVKMSDEEWYSGTLELLENHSYFTESARKLGHVQKQKNITKLKQILREI